MTSPTAYKWSALYTRNVPSPNQIVHKWVLPPSLFHTLTRPDNIDFKSGSCVFLYCYLTKHACFVCLCTRVSLHHGRQIWEFSINRIPIEFLNISMNLFIGIYWYSQNSTDFRYKHTVSHNFSQYTYVKTSPYWKC